MDRVGSLHDAVDAAARIAGLGSDYSVSWYEPELNSIEQFMLDITSGVMTRVYDGNDAPAWTRISWVQELLDDLGAVAGTEGRFTIAAHCMCKIR